MKRYDTTRDRIYNSNELKIDIPITFPFTKRNGRITRCYFYYYYYRVRIILRIAQRLSFISLVFQYLLTYDSSIEIRSR